MSQDMVEALCVGVFAVIIIVGIVRMKSPSKGADQMGAVIEGIQKVLEPGAKQIRQAKKQSRPEAKRGDGGKGDTDAMGGKAGTGGNPPEPV
jgi:hypothetical protein